VSESLSEGLKEIGGTLNAEIHEALDKGGLGQSDDVMETVDLAYRHYLDTPYLAESAAMTPEQFRQSALQYIMERDALAVDTEDQFNEDLEECVEPIGGDADVCDVVPDHGSSDQEVEEHIMETQNYVVVVHTQIMENIGTKTQPSWATAGSEVVLVQEALSSYGEARAIAARVAAGEIPVTLREGAYVLGIDVIPQGEYRQFYEAVETDDVVEEDTTDEVFFQQQVMEAQKLAGIKHGVYENKGTPSVHETRKRLESFTQEVMDEGVDEDIEDIEEAVFPQANLERAMSIIQETKRANPGVSTYDVTRAVCKKVYGDVSLAESLLEQALVINPSL
jgi:hypothetical protein